jgi:glycosyltransferase involved in cell wall biosynthesis
LKQNKPLVSVGMLVYNHGPYVAKAIQSVLMQEVDFEYEIVIADDCSTDNSREIILSYKKRYPDIIKLVFQEHNVGMRLNSDSLRHACTGKYRATLEGDDFWVITDKLKKQVEFLENNPDYIAIGGDFTCIDDNGKPCKFPWGDIRYTYCQDEEYTLEHVKQWLLPAHASTMMFRNVFHTCSPEMLEKFENTMILGDRRTTLFLVLQGKIRHTRETVCVRRVLRKSKTSMTTVTTKLNWHATNYGWLKEAERFAKEAFNVDLDLSERKIMRWKSALKVFALHPSKANFNVVRSIYSMCGDKPKYRKVAWEKLMQKTRNKIAREGFFVAFGRIIAFALKMPVKYFRNRKKRIDNNAKLILGAFSNVKS